MSQARTSPTRDSDHRTAITAAAKELNDLRERWLDPPEWTREEILEFPATPCSMPPSPAPAVGLPI